MRSGRDQERPERLLPPARSARFSPAMSTTAIVVAHRGHVFIVRRRRRSVLVALTRVRVDNPVLWTVADGCMIMA